MQMAMVVISGYVVASSPPAAKLIDGLAALPRSGRGAVAFVAAISMLTSLLNWGMSLIFSGLLVRALARRTGLQMDYRAAGAAGYLGLGATWALGLSSSAAQLQANAASLPKPLLADHRRHPVLADDLPLAVDGDRRGSDRDFDHVVAAVRPLRAEGSDGADDGRQRRRAGARRSTSRSGPASGWNTAR